MRKDMNEHHKECKSVTIGEALSSFIEQASEILNNIVKALIIQAVVIGIQAACFGFTDQLGSMRMFETIGHIYILIMAMVWAFEPSFKMPFYFLAAFVGLVADYYVNYSGFWLDKDRVKYIDISPRHDRLMLEPQIIGVIYAPSR